MTANAIDDFHQRKKLIREEAHARRNQQPDKDALSQQICATFVALPEYTAAKTVMYYVDVRSEVRTRNYLQTALTHGKRIVVPYCVNQELELFLLENMDELAIGMYKILEPREELRALPAERIAPPELDLIMVPGVAFDRHERPHGPRLWLLRQIVAACSAGGALGGAGV